MQKSGKYLTLFIHGQTVHTCSLCSVLEMLTAACREGLGGWFEELTSKQQAPGLINEANMEVPKTKVPQIAISGWLQK